jgi:hypothetical protein
MKPHINGLESVKKLSTSHSPGKIASLLLMLFSGVGFGIATAQQGSFWDDTDLVPFETGGSIGLSASAYSARGIENRRAPGVLQTHANFNFNAFGLRSGLNLNYSTDETGIRQNMNALRYNVSWRWLTIQVGDVNPQLSDYGLNGTTIRGGYIRAQPGDFIFEATGGRSRRLVRPTFESGFREPSFEQWAFGGKVGYGSKTGSYFHLSTFYAQDNVASLQENTIEIKPKENLTVTPDFRVDLFEGRFSLESQVTVSAFTRDLNSSKFSSSDLDIPEFFTAIYQPRVSTRLNYAGHAMATFQSDPFDITVGYERVQPGFASLGRGRLRNDQETLTLSPTLRFFRNRLSVQSNLSFGRDNLLGTRLQTQSNTNVATNVQMIFTESFNLTTSYNLLLNDVTTEPINGQESSNGGQSQISHNLMFQPGFIIPGENYTHNITLSGGYLSVENEFDGDSQILDMSYLSESYTGVLTYAITFPAGFTINSSGNYLTNQSNAGDIQNVGVNLGSSYALLNRKLTISVNVGINRNKFERDLSTGSTMTNRLQQLTGSVNTSYRLTDKDSFNLTIRSRNNRVMDGAGMRFTELEGSFRYQHTF